MNPENTLAGAALAGLMLPRPVQLAAKASLEADQRAAATKAETVRIANSEDAYNRRRVEHNFRQAETLEDPSEWVSYGTVEAPPNLPEAKERSDAYKRVADLKRREFEAIFDYRTGFELVEEAWRTRVEWRRSADAKELTLAQAEKLEAEADKLRPQLLQLASSLAEREFENRLERKEYRRAVSTAGRPLDLEEWRRDRDRKRAEAGKPKAAAKVSS